MLELVVPPGDDPEAALDGLADALVAVWLSRRRVATMKRVEDRRQPILDADHERP